jgi:hypothetical protein
MAAALVLERAASVLSVKTKPLKRASSCKTKVASWSTRVWNGAVRPLSPGQYFTQKQALDRSESAPLCWWDCFHVFCPTHGQWPYDEAFLQASLRNSWKIASGLALKQCCTDVQLCRALFFNVKIRRTRNNCWTRRLSATNATSPATRSQRLTSWTWPKNCPRHKPSPIPAKPCFWQRKTELSDSRVCHDFIDKDSKRRHGTTLERRWNKRPSWSWTRPTMSC